MLPGVELARKRRVHCHEANRRDPTKTSPAPAWPLGRPSATTASIDETAALALRRLEEKLLGHRAVSRWSRRRSSGHSSVSSSPSPSPTSSTSLGRFWNRHFEDVGWNLRGNSNRRVTNTNVNQTSSDSGNKNINSKALERTGSKIELCAVCLEQVEANQRAMWLPCSHRFHSECVLPWLAAHPHCPCCRTRLPALDLTDEQ